MWQMSQLIFQCLINYHHWVHQNKKVCFYKWKIKNNNKQMPSEDWEKKKKFY